MGTTIEIDVDGTAMPAYVARPGGETARPAVIVLQEIFGVNDKVRAIADLVATAGYLAVAPAVYHRHDPHFEVDVNPEGLARGREHAARVTPEGFRRDVASVLAWLGTQPDWNGKTATWGFCFGGALAYLSATCDGISAACAFYGRQITQGPQFIRFSEEIDAPLFLCFGGRDQGIPASDIATIEATLKEYGKRYELVVYPDEDHGFFRHNIGTGSTTGARDVWPKVQDFLARELGTTAK